MLFLILCYIFLDFNSLACNPCILLFLKKTSPLHLAHARKNREKSALGYYDFMTPFQLQIPLSTPITECVGPNISVFNYLSI